MGALAAILAILGATARLDAEQFAALNVAITAMGLVNLGGPQDEFGQRQTIHVAKFVEGLH
jgi:hypothetical protein